MESITAQSSRKWLQRHSVNVKRYLRRNHEREDWDTVFNLLYGEFPDEGMKLVRDFTLSESDKKIIFLKFLLESPQLVCGIISDERQGKDAVLCKIFQDVLDYCASHGLSVPRIVTLGNMRNPPFVEEKDMFFSFKSLPSGSKDKEVWIYCSELETVLPARDGASPESKLFSYICGTMAQNHQKLFGCCKLASMVDLNFWRKCNCKVFKYIQPEKLLIEGVERTNVISPLAMWHLPKSKFNYPETLLCFDSQIFVVDYLLPFWWSVAYSEQYKDIPVEKVWDFIDFMHSNGMSINSIETAVAQKFHRVLSSKDIKYHLGVS